MARTISNSRRARWERACATGRTALEAIEAAKADLEGAFSDLRDLQQEYQDWNDNLPDSLGNGNSPVSEKLEAVCGLDLPEQVDDIDEAAAALDEAEGADLPLGWGKD